MVDKDRVIDWLRPRVVRVLKFCIDCPGQCVANVQGDYHQHGHQDHTGVFHYNVLMNQQCVAQGATVCRMLQLLVLISAGDSLDTSLGTGWLQCDVVMTCMDYNTTIL